ncbi:hypothetical protein DACRYDRAFT_103889 [Dacryopinax primogenitus]|uniref:Uncharacterized protein n=1 Tax=Dacryopinax primogenitus (strain DJM 731) TaxID=1858805 RepID=M5GGF6_DACPD|nr:uncharacterized protein DACRYDRAFT_103889 [Dacryopinax primogenitus]EJU05403.1 hypothetical protein DACRYDRAFT_103889 [Dacryopinax primogenitus]
MAIPPSVELASIRSDKRLEATRFMALALFEAHDDLLGLLGNHTVDSVRLWEQKEWTGYIVTVTVNLHETLRIIDPEPVQLQSGESIDVEKVQGPSMLALVCNVRRPSSSPTPIGASSSSSTSNMIPTRIDWNAPVPFHSAT